MVGRGGGTPPLRNGRQSGRLAEHALKDRVDMAEVMAEIEILFDLGSAQMLSHVLVVLEQGQKIAAAAPHLHGVALDQPVSLLARDASLRERDQDSLRVHESAEPVEIFGHVV